MKKIAFLILASAIFFFSCKTTNSSAENAAQNFSDAGEISQVDESAISDSQNEEVEIPDSESDQKSAPNENQTQTSDGIQDEQNAEEKIGTDENAQIQDGYYRIERSETDSAQENPTDESPQKNDSPSSEILPQGNSSEIEGEEYSTQNENARQEEISSEEKIPQDETSSARAPQAEQNLSQDEFVESENEPAKNGGEDASISAPRDSESAELNSAQSESNSQTPPAVQPEIETQSQSAATRNSAGNNSEGQNQNSRQRQNDASRQNQRQNAPADSAQNVPQRNPVPQGNGARQNSSNGNSAQVPPTGNSARQNSKNENSSTENGSEIASEYDFSGNGESTDEIQIEEKPKPIPSRSLTLKRNQFVDIIYPGSGWIYLGEEGGDHFTFYGRKQNRGESTFTLRSKKAGKALLHFYKNDALTGKYIDDYIAIEIGDVNALDSSHVIAPSYAQAVPKKFERENLARESSDEKTEMASIDEGSVSQDSGVDEKIVPNAGFEKKLDESPPAPAKTENRPTERVQTAIQDSRSESKDDASITSIAASENSVGMKEDKNVSSSQQKDGNAAQDFLRRAQTAYDEKRYADSLSLLKSFFEVATSDFDAGFYLQGLVLEAQSEVRDIKSAIGSYDTVVKNFPQSKFWTRANERGIYLKRFYINIR
ncbi:MAG: hypothetical protein K2I95_06810 [Treponemataceae bacterium]|nr:hypothetical protein [Treponemataceae bacterium]